MGEEGKGREGERRGVVGRIRKVVVTLFALPTSLETSLPLKLLGEEAWRPARMAVRLGG